MLKHSTSATPSVNCLSCRHSSNTVMAAGQGDPAAGQAEHQNLSGRHVTIGEAPPDVVGVRQFGGILVSTAGDVDTWQGRGGGCVLAEAGGGCMAVPAVFPALAGSVGGGAIGGLRSPPKHG